MRSWFDCRTERRSETEAVEDKCGQDIVDIRGAGWHKRWGESWGNIVSQELDIQVGMIQHRILQLFISLKLLIVLGPLS